ncbi:hypothetical protein [Bacteroides caecimuris]|jgi:hypothetical protein|uniref:hypothetical protein n=1 Tax=Bacteroides caecimuris TaxID=1796613 RepID=UPI0025711D7B|nr:hypothetical protein [Bacteroides caecimuris]
MNEFLMTTYTIALPIVLGYIVWLLKEQRKVRSANSEGTKCLLREKLIDYHDKYMEKEAIPSYALRNWVEMFNAYKRLGGNGMIDGMDKEIHDLPII